MLNTGQIAEGNLNMMNTMNKTIPFILYSRKGNLICIYPRIYGLQNVEFCTHPEKDGEINQRHKFHNTILQYIAHAKSLQLSVTSMDRAPDNKWKCFLRGELGSFLSFTALKYFQHCPIGFPSKQSHHVLSTNIKTHW